MPSEIRSSSKNLESVGDMGYSLELKRSSRQHETSKTVKEKILSPRANQSLKFQDKFKVENPVDRPCASHRELRQNPDDGLLVQPKSLGNHQNQSVRRKATNDDELVKYMSNLPGYLQRVEKEENLQEKALNFGVLDWERLEKWKYSQKRDPARGSMNGSSTSSNSSLFTRSGSSTHSSKVPSKTLAHQRKQPPSLCSHLNSSRKEGISQGVKQSKGKVIRRQDFETAPNSTLEGQQILPGTDKSSRRIYSHRMRDKGKRNNLDEKIIPEMGTSSPNLGNYGVLVTSKEKMIAQDDETKKRAEELQASDFSLAHRHCPGEHKNIVLLLPSDSPRKSCSEAFQLSEPRTLFDGKLTQANQKSFSDGFSPEDFHSVELGPEIPHSCPLPCMVETNTEPDLKPHSLITAHGMELPSGSPRMSPCSNETPIMQSEGKYAENKSKIKPTRSTVIESSQRLDRGNAELAVAKGRDPSPSRWFGIGLNKMRRSFSFKEGSAVPQLSSTYLSVKSGPVRSEASTCLDNSNRSPVRSEAFTCLDNSNRDKVNANSRGRSSPLRRLLDPLLKPKAANSLHSAETVQPLKGNLNSLSFKPINAIESLQNEKHEASSVQALLQLTIKNGLPLFKFVVDNNRDVLVAKQLSSSGKDDSSWIYTFCSVREIKKKSGIRINQGSKGKSCGYVYNVVGQMKVSSSNLTGQNSKEQFMVTESVLFSVDLRQADHETPELMPNRELAAIVVKVPSESLSHDEDQSDKDRDLSEKGFHEHSPEDRCLCDSGNSKNSNSTVVILPSGVHSLPNRGEPSPLIDRWKSGGSCDCGGWDVGCKLRILTNQGQCCKISRPCKASPVTDRFDLFVQGGAQEKRSIFSLAPFEKGICSVEFNSSISLLQAFSICVGVISSQKSSDLSQVSNPSEARLFQEPISNGYDRIKTPTIVQGEALAKYVPSPPLSPVGRA